MWHEDNAFLRPFVPFLFFSLRNLLPDVLRFPTFYPRIEISPFYYIISSDYFLSCGGARVREIFFLFAIRSCSNEIRRSELLIYSNVARIIDRIMDKSGGVKGFSLSPTMLDRSRLSVRIVCRGKFPWNLYIFGDAKTGRKKGRTREG